MARVKQTVRGGRGEGKPATFLRGADQLQTLAAMASHPRDEYHVEK